jgi:APA family basic amino acid/polyamine antiporter
MNEADQIKGELQRQIGLASATALVVGEVIAVGIFLTPAEMSKTLGSPMWLCIVWLVMGGMALSGALCYGELAARYPESGGGYVYLREAYGERVAFLYGWKSMLIMDPGITAALGIGLASYVGYLIDLSPFARKAVGVGAILTLAVANILGVKFGALLLRGFAILKIGLLLAIVVWAIGFQLGDWANFTPFISQRAGSAPLPQALAGSLVAAFFSFGGWWDVSKLAGEVRNPTRNVPRALAFGVIIVTCLYMIISAVFIYLVPIDRVTDGETFAAQAGEILFGRTGGFIFSIIVIISVLGSLQAVIMSAPRVYYAMARDQLFFSGIAAIHPRFKTPARAIALQAGLASLLVLLGSFDQIIAYFIFVTVIFIAMTVASVFVLKKRSGSTSQTPGYPFTPIIFLTLVALLLVLLGTSRPKQAALGVAIVAAGAIVYQQLFSKRRAVTERRAHDLD